MSDQGFPELAGEAVKDEQMRINLRNATGAIEARRAAAASELSDWEELRSAGAAIKDSALRDLAQNLERFEAALQSSGGQVHWARDADEANRTVVELVRRAGATSVTKAKSITTDEIGLNDALRDAGIAALETDLAELIVQLADDRGSHILVPALHLNRREIGELFRRTIVADGQELSDEPEELAAAARSYLREAMLSSRVGISGANFAVAETGTICVVESEGNARMCTTLPPVLITVMGIEKVIQRWEDLGVFLQLLPRSATGERMSPYVSLWTGVHAGETVEEFHLVLVDNGRTSVLADPVGREALRCIRCGACQNVCPVYNRAGGHAYASVYQGPIGAVLEPQLTGFKSGATLPWASSLCGACADVCPVKIDLPRLLIHLRGRGVKEAGAGTSKPERAVMRLLGRVLETRIGIAVLQRMARFFGRGPLLRVFGKIGPLKAWAETRELPSTPKQSFRDWWHERGS